MKAIILCAGYGTRLMPLTGILPKPLFPLTDNRVIDYIIDSLKGIGISALGINLHHLGHLIQDYLGEDTHRGLKLYYSPEEVLLDTGGGLSRFASFIGNDEDFILHNCDVITSLKLSEAIAYHRKKKPLLTMVLVDLPGRNRVMVDSENQVMNLSATKNQPLPRGCRLLYGGGIWIYRREIFNYLPDTREPYSIIPILRNLIEKEPGSVISYHDPGQISWTDIGTPEEYLECHRRILSARPDHQLLARGVTIGRGVSLKGFISAGTGAVIGDNCRLRDCVIWPGAVIPPGTTLEKAIVAGDTILHVT